MNSLLDKIFKAIENGRVSYVTNWYTNGIGRHVIVFNMTQMDQQDIIFMQQPDNIMNPVTFKLMGLAWTYAPNFGHAKLSDDEYDSVIRAIEQRFEKPISELSNYKIGYSTARTLNFEREIEGDMWQKMADMCDLLVIEELMKGNKDDTQS